MQIIQNLPSGFQDKQTMLALGIILLVVDGISLLFFLCLFGKIRKAIRIIQCAATFVTQVCTIMVSPIIMFSSILLFFVFWMIVSLYIFSSGEVVQHPQNPYGDIVWNVGVKRSLGFYLFTLFWNSGLAIAVSQFVTASAASMWYFSHRPQ